MLHQHAETAEPRVRRAPSRAGAAAVLAAVTLATPFLAQPAHAAPETIDCDTASGSETAEPRVRRAPSRAGAAAVLAAVTLASPFLAQPAHAAPETIDCDTASGSEWDACGSLVSTAECVWDNQDGTYTLALGFHNPSGYTLHAAIDGGNNSLTAAQGVSTGDPGQLATFPPGTYRTAFTVTWEANGSQTPVRWQLMDQNQRWDRRHTACDTKPVPVAGSAGGLVLGSLVLTALLAGFASRRDRLLTAVRRHPVVGRGPGSA